MIGILTPDVISSRLPQIIGSWIFPEFVGVVLTQYQKLIAWRTFSLGFIKNDRFGRIIVVIPLSGATFNLAPATRQSPEARSNDFCQPLRLLFDLALVLSFDHNSGKILGAGITQK